MSVTSSKKWVKGLDSLRFILAFIVLLSHYNSAPVYALARASLPALKFCSVLLTNLFDGTAAVMAFFILSGFVIHYHYKGKIDNLKQYALRRFTRIFLPLIIVFFIGTKFDHPEKAAMWSLICELAYYALYPLLIAIKISWLKKVVFAYIISAIVIFIGAHHDVMALFTQADPYQGFYWQLGPFLTWIVGLPLWLLGVLIAESIDNREGISFSRIFFYRLITFIASCICAAAQLYWHVSFIISMNIFALLLFKWIEAEILYFKHRVPSPLLEKMGKFSYSLYLCHPTIYIIFSTWIVNDITTYCLFIFLALLFSYLFYLLVERPSHKLAMRLSKL